MKKETKNGEVNYTTILHLDIDKEGSIKNLNNVIKEFNLDLDKIKVYYYSNLEDTDHRLGAIVGNLKKLNIAFERGGISKSIKKDTVDKTKSLIIDYFRNVLKNKGSKHIIVNLDAEVLFYNNALKDIYGIEILYIASLYVKDIGNVLDKMLNIIDRMHLKHTLLEASKTKYKKVVLVDSDNVVCSIGDFNYNYNIFKDMDTLFIFVGVSLPCNFLNYNKKLMDKLVNKFNLQDLVDRSLYINIDTFKLGESDKVCIKELSDNLIYLLSIYLKLVKNKKLFVFSLDSYMHLVNYVADSYIISRINYFMCFNLVTSKDGYNYNKYKDIVLCSILAIISDKDITTSRLIKDLDTWGFNGKELVDGMVKLYGNCKILGLM